MPKKLHFRVSGHLRWLKAWRDLTTDKLRTTLVVLSIAVGVFAFGGIFGARNIIDRELNQNFLAIQPASIIIETDPFSAELVEAARRWPGVALANGRRELPVRVEVNPDTWIDLRLVIVDDYEKLSVNRIEPQSGPWPPPKRTLLMERNSLALYDTAVGEPLTITFADGRERTVRIAGLTHDMNQAPAQVFGVGFAYMTVDTAAWLGLPTTFNQLQIRVTGDTRDLDHLTDVTHTVEHQLQTSGREIFRSEIPKPDSHFAFDFLPAIIYLMNALGGLSLLLSSLLIFNVLSAILQQHVRQIGVMKAIGGRSATIAAIYLRMVILFAILAVTLSLPLGLMGAYGLTVFVAGQLNFDIQWPLVDGPVILFELFVALIVPVLAALFPVISATRMSIYDALSDTGLRVSNTEGVLERLRFINMLPRPVRLSLRNTFRRRGRLLLTLFTLALGGAIFISVMTLRTSLFATLEDTLISRGYDVQVRFGRLYRGEQIETLVETVPGVISSESWRVVNGVPRRPNNSDGELLFLNGLPPDTRLFHPEVREGRWLTENDSQSGAAVVHHNLIKKEPWLQLGSELMIVVNGRETRWTIVGITAELQPPIGPTHVYVDYEALTRALGGFGQTDSVQIELDTHTPAVQTAKKEELERLLADQNYQVVQTRSAADDRALFTERFNILTIILTGLSVLIATVGSLGLMGTMAINVMERRREIGVLRSIGASDTAVVSIFVSEGLVIGLLSWFGAMILSQPISRLMSIQLGINFLGFPLNYVFAFWGAAVWLIVVALLSIMASYIPARSAAQLKIRDALAYE